MITSSFLGDIVSAELRQLGAKRIEEVRNGIFYIARFELDEHTKLVYVFNITKKERYFLQRMEPYPMSFGYFSSVNDIVTFIKRDLAQFKNAHRSHNFEKFLRAAKEFKQSAAELERLFLEHNVSAEEMDGLVEEMQRIRARLTAGKDRFDEIG